MKGGDLIVIEVGGDESLRREGSIDHFDVLDGDSLRLHAFLVWPKIMTGGGHDKAAFAEQFQSIGDVRGAAAELAAHLRYQERHIQNMNLVRKDVRLEAVREQQYRVVGYRTADQCGFVRGIFLRHRTPFNSNSHSTGKA